ncbi:MAG: glycosyltransferase [Thermoanaerobaculia bacterium]
MRAYNIAKWLSRRGWEVTVVTPAVEVWRNPESAGEVELMLAREGIRCIRTEHRWRVLSPAHLAGPDSWAWLVAGGVVRRAARLSGFEVEVGWLSEAERACAGLEGQDVDLILATGAPFTSFELASRLAGRLRRPLVLDYRDLWTTNPHVGPPRESAFAAEKALLRRCAAAIAVSPGVADSLQSQCPPGMRVHVITNGHDPEELAEIRPIRFDHFAIVYAGVFYPPKRVITPVMAAFQQLKSLRPVGADWRFHYYGLQSDHVRSAAAEHGVGDKVFLHGLQPRRKVLAAVKGAGVSVIIASVEQSASRRDRGIVTGKVFDAIGLGTPMLVVAPAGSDLEAIVRTAGRGGRFDGTETDRMASFLANAIEGRVPPSGQPAVYAWPNMVTELDAVLRSCLEAHQKPVARSAASAAMIGS